MRELAAIIRLSRTLICWTSPCSLRSAGTKPTPCRDRRARAAEERRAAGDLDVPVRPVQAEDRLEQLGAARADESGESHDLTGRDVESRRPRTRPAG